MHNCALSGVGNQAHTYFEMAWTLAVKHAPEDFELLVALSSEVISFYLMLIADPSVPPCSPPPRAAAAAAAAATAAAAAGLFVDWASSPSDLLSASSRRGEHRPPATPEVFAQVNLHRLRRVGIVATGSLHGNTVR